MEGPLVDVVDDQQQPEERAPVLLFHPGRDQVDQEAKPKVGQEQPAKKRVFLGKKRCQNTGDNGLEECKRPLSMLTIAYRKKQI